MKTKIIFRKAKISDAIKVKKIIDAYAKEGIMLFRPIYEIYGNIRDFFIAEQEKKAIGYLKKAVDRPIWGVLYLWKSQAH